MLRRFLRTFVFIPAAVTPPPAPEPQNPPPAEVLKHKEKIDKLLTSTAISPKNPASLHVQSQILQVETQTLLSSAKKTLPATCKQALFYNQALMDLMRLELEMGTDLDPPFNISRQERRSYTVNKLSATNRDFTRLLDQCPNGTYEFEAQKTSDSEPSEIRLNGLPR